MNYHTLSVFHEASHNRLLFLAAVVLLALQVSNSFAQEEQSIVITTNKAHYVPGDIVTLNGTVSGQPNALVALQIKDSSGNLILIRTVSSDQNGNFALQFKLPPTATSGDFNIIASAKVNGFIVTQTKIMTATVPEFGPITMPLFGVSLVLTVVIFAMANKSKNLHY
ncbi:hypothetical protein [Candidatus Nitrosotalea okcheonensis]|uniref:Macroglobulin domain-containing protein n=1 Tax=Candidatus Nitrosotalea okcheonensis TaxID=1903276 RepID=A0A2H1FCV0_9ARCH|nr:hypothetical protein [Candidatus Nitrosotalea okcheonensis]MDE1728126.1 hypothetical protein [Nitrososphaerota archaeon]MDE1830885.1 hypothetical protein [Nitrososphaerota archaeon]MDE1840853.1 hypothetical protein [Nitrososphaerota archaeon]MDE1877093.1 hypothetical protein [Nitrososphaerota archaeon]SMH70594.1 exported protein of unknown function [Candidatus Nitrosotalea okcheonensis]